jgi:hypothetical protein
MLERSTLSADAAAQTVTRRYGSSQRIANPFSAGHAGSASEQPPQARGAAGAASTTASLRTMAQARAASPFAAFVRRASMPSAPASEGPAADSGATVAPVIPPSRGAFGRFKVPPGTADVSEPGPADEQATPASSAPREARAPSVRRFGGLGRGAEPERKKVSYTDEQMELQHSRAPLVVADAFAGCGKTTAAVGYAEHHSDWKILYLCLNNANAAEARGRFPRNVEARTTHAVARAAIKPDANRVTDRWKPMLVQDLMGISPRQAAFTIRVLGEFFGSSDQQVTMKHVEVVSEKYDMTARDQEDALAHARLAWTRMQRDDPRMLMPHDAYLKMFALRAPQLPYDAIVFDEAQDANPVTLQILKGQQSLKQLLAIGDRHQSIYGFRGAVNAMEVLSRDAERHYLTKTWRFGPRVADLANLVLGELKGETKRIQGLGADGTWNEERHTHLTRTNAQLFRLAAERQGHGVHWVGGVEKYRIDLVQDAYHLFASERHEVRDDLMRRKFQHWDEYVRYAEDAGDAEARILVKVIDEFKHDTPALVESIKRNAVKEASEADLVLTTAHRSKGSEWNNVRIGEDFEVLEEAEQALADNAPDRFPEQDVNLFYVALTRAKNALQLNPEAQRWISNLERHRQDRAAAQARLRAALEQTRRDFNQQSDRADLSRQRAA